MKTKLLLLVFASSLLAIQSCDNDATDEPDFNVSISGPGNSNNPYDSIGEQHNLKLIHYIDSVKCPSSTTVEDVYNHYYQQGLMSSTDLVSSLDQVDYNTDGYTGYIDSLYNVHTYMWPYYLDIRDIVNNGESLNQIVQMLIDYENSLDLSSFSSQEQMTIYSALSVARYSTYMWSDKAEGGLGYLANCQSNKYIGDSRKTHHIVLSDIWGTFASGLTTWNPATALLGGVISSAITWINWDV